MLYSVKSVANFVHMEIIDVILGSADECPHCYFRNWESSRDKHFSSLPGSYHFSSAWIQLSLFMR